MVDRMTTDQKTQGQDPTQQQTQTGNKLIILGCGPSAGVPSLSGYWGDCDPHNPYNWRTRTSAYGEVNGVRFLIDTSPDLRLQMLNNHVGDLDAVFFTHTHADHTHGIDDLKSIYFHRQRKKIPIYGTHAVLNALQDRFSYLFQEGHPIYPPVLEPRPFAEPFDDIFLGSLTVQAFQQIHGEGERSTGFRMGKMAYSTDFSDLPDASLDVLRDLDLWIVDCLSMDQRPTHMSLEGALRWIERVKPKKAILTHMNQTLDYESVLKRLPESVKPAYDGMVLYF